MPDVYTYISRYRITYTPEATEAEPEPRPMVLLDRADECEAEPAFAGGPTAQQEELILSAWQYCRSRGNAAITLTFDQFARATSAATAQAAGLERWLWCLHHPQGVMRLQTAWDVFGRPLVDWAMDATLVSCTPTELTNATSPFVDAAGIHLAYEFMVSHISPAATTG